MSTDYVEPPVLSKFERKQAKHNKKTEDMVQCPFCKALSYPRIYVEPTTDQEKNAIICGSCHKDMKPYMVMAGEFTKRMEAEWKREDYTDPNKILENMDDSGELKKYPDAKKVMAEVMADYDAGKLG